MPEISTDFVHTKLNSQFRVNSLGWEPLNWNAAVYKASFLLETAVLIKDLIYFTAWPLLRLFNR